MKVNDVLFYAALLCLAIGVLTILAGFDLVGLILVAVGMIGMIAIGEYEGRKK